MHKKFLSAALLLTLSCGALSAEEKPAIGIVNFASCITDSKAGKKEQKDFETVRKQMSDLIEGADKELREISAKFDDPEYLDSLSPKAEEELKAKFQARQEDLARYQNQFYQMMNHAQMQMVQKINANIAKASEKIATEQNLTYVINKEACFYFSPKLDITHEIITEMDRLFEIDQKSDSLTDASKSLDLLESSQEQAE